jgi:hypothetical protein
VEESRSVLLFEAFDLLANGRLADSEVLGSAGEALLFDDLAKGS